jgi:hypothetical protein
MFIAVSLNINFASKKKSTELEIFLCIAFTFPPRPHFKKDRSNTQDTSIASAVDL